MDENSTQEPIVATTADDIITPTPPETQIPSTPEVPTEGKPSADKVLAAFLNATGIELKILKLEVTAAYKVDTSQPKE